MSISPEAATIIVGLLSALVGGGGLFLAIRKFPLERVATTAEANSDNAAAASSISSAYASLLETYTKTFKQLQDRDFELLELRLRMAKLEESVRLSGIDLDTEREKRIAAEQQRDTLIAQVSELQSQVEELRKEISNLRPVPIIMPSGL